MGAPADWWNANDLEGLWDARELRPDDVLLVLNVLPTDSVSGKRQMSLYKFILA